MSHAASHEPETGPLPGHGHVGRICGAKTRNGTPCRNPARENGRCRNHGGNYAIGVAHHNYKTGQHSRSLPARMSDDYEKYLRDPQIASSKSGIALMKVRIDDLLSRVDHGESGELWESLQEAWKVLQEMIGRERCGVAGVGVDPARDTDDALESLGLIISQGGQDWQLWKEIRETEEQRRKAAESQTKREIAAFSLVNAEKLAALQGAVAAILKTYVRDPHDLAAASRRLHEVAVGTGSVN